MASLIRRVLEMNIGYLISSDRSPVSNLPDEEMLIWNDTHWWKRSSSSLSLSVPNLFRGRQIAPNHFSNKSIPPFLRRSSRQHWQHSSIVSTFDWTGKNPIRTITLESIQCSLVDSVCCAVLLSLPFVRFSGIFYAYLSNSQVFQRVRLQSACYSENALSLADKQSQSCTDEENKIPEL